MDDRPAWARRMREERTARGWSQVMAVRALMARLPYDPDGPDEQSMVRQWKRWESGAKFPDKYKTHIAATFGSVTGAFFPEHARERAQLQIATGMDTVEIVARMRASDVDQATLDALRITVDRLCCEYAYTPAAQLLSEGRAWMGRVVTMLNQRVSLSQMRDLYALAGKLALLVGCVEYDSGEDTKAEATRRAALSLGDEAGHLGVIGWGHEMRCWFALTRGDYRGVIQAANDGIALAPRESVAAQLYAQQAKAWARWATGSRRRSHSTRAVSSSKLCPTRSRLRTISWWTPRSSTSTAWTATGGSARTSSPSSSRARSSARAPTGTDPSARPCESPRPVSRSRSRLRGAVTSTRRCRTASAPLAATASPSPA